MRFCQGYYAASADIEQMFHLVHVRPPDQNALRFLWRENLSEEPQDYVMNVHLFGKNDSTCIANYAFRKYAQDSSDSNAETLFAVENEFYMDDFLRSDNSLSNLYEVCHNVTTVLQK